MFKVGRNFDFLYKGLIYTNEDGSVVGDTNGTGLVMTDSLRLVEFDNLHTFFTKAYNNFLYNDGIPLLGRSTWETGNRRQYWSCSHMPRTDTAGTSIENAFVNHFWSYGSRGYTGPSQALSFAPLAAMAHQGALWSYGNGQVENIVHSLLKGTWTEDEIVYGDDDLNRILNNSFDYGFYGKSPSDLFDNIYHSGTNGISGESFSRRILPDIYKDVVGNYYEPGKYSYRTNLMWSVPAALTLAASTLDTTIEEMKLIEREEYRDVLTTTVDWESTNEYRPEGMRPWEHLQATVRIYKDRDEFGNVEFMWSLNTSCPIPNNVMEFSQTLSSSTNRVSLPKNYGTYRFSGMLPGSPINPRVQFQEMAAGIHSNRFDLIDSFHDYIQSPTLAGQKLVRMYFTWYDNPGSFVECVAYFPDYEYEMYMIYSAFYEDLWVKDQTATVDYDPFITLKGSYSFSRSFPTARASSYHFGLPPPSERLDDTTFHMAAAELFKRPSTMIFIAEPYTIEVENPVTLDYNPEDTENEYYREYYFGGAETADKAIKIVKDRVESNVIGNTLKFTPGFDLSMRPEDMLVGSMEISGDGPLETHVTYSPEWGSYYVSFDDDGFIEGVFSDELGGRPVYEIEQYLFLNWYANLDRKPSVRANVEQLDSRNIRPPVQIDDRFGLLMKNTWKCHINE